MNWATRLMILLVALLFIRHSFAQGYQPPPKPLPEGTAIHDVCRAVFVNTDDKPLYNQCRSARRTHSWAEGITAFKYTFISLSITLGLVGIIPYAQTEDTTLWLVSGGMLGLGLLTIIPESIADARASSKKNRVINKYNETIKKKTSLLPAEPVYYMGYRWRF